MKVISRAVILCGLLSASLFVAGCAATAGGKKTSSITIKEDHILDTSDMDQSSALIVIRYPAIIADDAKEDYVFAYAQKAIGGSLTLEKQADPNVEKVADLALAKSNFYAMSVYSALIEELPADRVLLSPHVVYSEGGLKSKPLLASENTPTVLTFDFMTYSFPDLEEMMESPPLTFGDLVTPLGVLSTNHWGRPETHGLLLSSDPLLDTTWARAQSDLVAIINGRVNRTKIKYDPTLSFIYHLNNPAADQEDVPSGSLSQAIYNNAIAVYPVEKVQLDGEIVEALQEVPEDPFRDSFADNFAERVVRMLNNIDNRKAVYLDTFAALERFDEEVAAAYLSRDISPSVKARLRRAEQLLAAERQFFAAQAEALYKGVAEGNYGVQMREMQVAEYETIEERRSLARQQNWNMAVGMLAAAASGYAQGMASNQSVYNSANAQNWQNISSNMMYVSMSSINNTELLALQSTAVGENFLVAMAPALDQQVSVQVDLIEGSEEITAASHEEFEAQLMAIYQRSASNISSPPPQKCAFRSPNFTAMGVWHGVCVNGMAQGRGYGTLVEAGVGALRYVGEASSGMANGSGFMVVFDPTFRGGVTYEGSFASGLPNGPIRFSVPGSASKIRNFAMGEDVGRADEEMWQPAEF